MKWEKEDIKNILKEHKIYSDELIISLWQYCVGNGQCLLDKQKEEILDLITDEIVIAQKEGQPTSRLTSLFNKIK